MTMIGRLKITLLLTSYDFLLCDIFLDVDCSVFALWLIHHAFSNVSRVTFTVQFSAIITNAYDTATNLYFSHSNLVANIC